MIGLLFDTGFWYDALFIIAGLVLILICFKYPKGGKWFAGTIAGLAIVAATGYCGINLYGYYSAHGGIYGALSGRDETNLIQVEDFKFTFNNLELLQDDTGAYTATVILDELIRLDQGKSYGAFINGVPCDLVEYGKNYLVSDFSYVFYNENFEETCKDTLSFRFSFFENFTKIIIKSNGNDTAIRNWNKFLNANNMVLTIQPINYLDGTDISQGEGDISNFRTVTYYSDPGEVFVKQIYMKGSTLNPAAFPTRTEAICTGWKIDGLLVPSGYTVNDNVDIYAVWEARQKYEINFMYDGQPYLSQSYFEGEKVEFPVIEGIDGWSEFESIKTPLYVDTSKIYSIKDKTYYALKTRTCIIEETSKPTASLTVPYNYDFSSRLLRFQTFERSSTVYYTMKLRVTFDLYDNGTKTGQVFTQTFDITSDEKQFFIGIILPDGVVKRSSSSEISTNYSYIRFGFGGNVGLVQLFFNNGSDRGNFFIYFHFSKIEILGISSIC